MIQKTVFLLFRHIYVIRMKPYVEKMVAGKHASIVFIIKQP